MIIWKRLCLVGKTNPNLIPASGRGTPAFIFYQVTTRHKNLWRVATKNVTPLWYSKTITKGQTMKKMALHMTPAGFIYECYECGEFMETNKADTHECETYQQEDFGWFGEIGLWD